MKTLATIFQPFLDDPTLTARDSGARVVDTTERELTLETRYEVRNILGRGGMGEVRLCRDARIGRDVAIKVALAGAEHERFLREARVQAQLDHPSIVPVYEIEILDDGTAYFAMKRVRGKTLAALLHEDALPLRKLLSAFTSVCLAVDFAHNKGVVHRDIKPGNVMLGDFGEVYLLDWGLARVGRGASDDDPLGDGDARAATAEREPVAAGATPATVAGSLLGTPGYMAPEQIDPSVGPIGPATDVYALGALLFEIAAREPYIRAADALEATLLTLRGVEPRPALRAPGRAVPAAIDAICARALAIEPAHRYQSARELHDAVDAVIAGEAQASQRREMARMHLASAERALVAPDDDRSRAEALKELGSAVAVDPDNEEARASLLRLLTSPPAHRPPEVTRRIDEDRNEQMRLLARYSVGSALPFFALVPVAAWVGVRDWLLLAYTLIALGVAIVLNVLVARSKQPSMALQTAAVVADLAGLLPLTRLTGPVGFLSVLIVATATARQVHPDLWHRRVSTALGCVTVAAALAWEAVSPQYMFVSGGVMVKEMLLTLDERSLVFLILCIAAAIITPSVLLARTRATLARAEESLHVQRWQLEQLVKS